jgi:hypothetical protein
MGVGDALGRVERTEAVEVGEACAVEVDEACAVEENGDAVDLAEVRVCTCVISP